MMAEAYPLCWPNGRARTPAWKRQRSKFKTGFGAARNLLFAELGRMSAREIILSTSIPLRNDGLPRANMRPDNGDTGVAVYFQRKGKQMVVACDKYDRSEDNVYAIAKTIDAIRGIERWGSSDMMERAFTGFKALAAENDGPSWWAVLQVRAGATPAEINAAYRELAKIAHPDSSTGSHEAMAALNAAREQGLAITQGVA